MDKILKSKKSLENVDQISKSNNRLIEYNEIDDEEKWKVAFIHEVTIVKFA